MQSAVTSEDLRKQATEYKQNIQLAESLERLFKNRDFKKVILDGYLTEDCLRQIKLASNQYLDERARNAAEFNAKAAGSLENYFEGVRQIGAESQRQYESNMHEAYLVEQEEQEAEANE